VADKMGIDLIWFGVLLCVNMQTSFMHPPFGFALFYLRGISDTLFKNGALPKKVESRDIYLGAIPWVVMQLVLVVIVIFVPETVTSFLDKPEVLDTNQAMEQLEQQATQTEPAAAAGSPAAEGGAKEPATPEDAARAALEQASKEASDSDAAMKALEDALKEQPKK
jgi:Tripartite ATP-independent periplasmic transporter, DctM component